MSVNTERPSRTHPKTYTMYGKSVRRTLNEILGRGEWACGDRGWMSTFARARVPRTTKAEARTLHANPTLLLSN